MRRKKKGRSIRAAEESQHNSVRCHIPSPVDERVNNRNNAQKHPEDINIGAASIILFRIGVKKVFCDVRENLKKGPACV